MFEPHIPIRFIKTNLQDASLRARVVMLWTVPVVRNFTPTYNNLHILLSDDMGDEIQASLYGPPVNFFSRSMHEGCVYDFAFFGVIPNIGKFRPTGHDFRIIFRGTFDCLLLGAYVNQFYAYISTRHESITALLLKRAKPEESKG
ncbi:hypothetical protein RIF29_24633 [Crotalaria pallida]|uniref:Replication protein A 70 kDa DNA-binding subunit B/D first OB fold domain-containing protein n=1 Tax=Crotalaria pallida TaxID=3830 RepID=A0AAN9EKZ3_CROPI